MRKQNKKLVMAYGLGYLTAGAISGYVIKYQEKKIKAYEAFSKNLLAVVEKYQPYIPEDVAQEAAVNFTFELMAHKFKEK